MLDDVAVWSESFRLHKCTSLLSACTSMCHHACMYTRRLLPANRHHSPQSHSISLNLAPLPYLALLYITLSYHSLSLSHIISTQLNITHKSPLQYHTHKHTHTHSCSCTCSVVTTVPRFVTDPISHPFHHRLQRIYIAYQRCAIVYLHIHMLCVMGWDISWHIINSAV